MLGSENVVIELFHQNSWRGSEKGWYCGVYGKHSRLLFFTSQKCKFLEIVDCVLHMVFAFIARGIDAVTETKSLSIVPDRAVTYPYTD